MYILGDDWLYPIAGEAKSNFGSGRCGGRDGIYIYRIVDLYICICLHYTKGIFLRRF